MGKHSRGKYLEIVDWYSTNSFTIPSDALETRVFVMFALNSENSYRELATRFVVVMFATSPEKNRESANHFESDEA